MFPKTTTIAINPVKRVIKHELIFKPISTDQTSGASGVRQSAAEQMNGVNGASERTLQATEWPIENAVICDLKEFLTLSLVSQSQFDHHKDNLFPIISILMTLMSIFGCVGIRGSVRRSVRPLCLLENRSFWFFFSCGDVMYQT